MKATSPYMTSPYQTFLPDFPLQDFPLQDFPLQEEEEEVPNSLILSFLWLLVIVRESLEMGATFGRPSD